MNFPRVSGGLLLSLLGLPFLSPAQTGKIVTNHIGYEYNQPKVAVLVADGDASTLDGAAFQVLRAGDHQVVYTGRLKCAGPVQKWKHWAFGVMDFSPVQAEGEYEVALRGSGGELRSYPFRIGRQVLASETISDIIYYFKGQRCSGLLDEADRHLKLAVPKAGDVDSIGKIDAHGGWYDATGDYGKHLSHLSFSNYFNPQQISLTVWGLLKSYQWLGRRGGTDYRQYRRRLLDEAMYGADFLARVKVPGESFYRSVSAPGPGKKAKDRVIDAESKWYKIKQSKDQSWGTEQGRNTDPYAHDANFRSGAGVAIAALALAGTFDTSGEYSNAAYLKVAEEAFAFLQQHNREMTSDGKENIVDDYCALLAATELYKATKKQVYQVAAAKRAAGLMERLKSWKGYTDYWRADTGDRPFFHPSDAGLPVVSLLNYYPLASAGEQVRIKAVIRRSMAHELAITGEVANPFGYGRQLVEDTSGRRYSSFFFPHGSDASPWWQGENARLGSMATAARMAAPLFGDEPAFRDSLVRYGLDQLNWILGLNPFDACMLQGKGHNNPVYGFFGSFEYTNAPGGIVNGITSGLEDESDIDLNLSYAQTGKDYDWRWAEQWLPHATWFLLAVSFEE